MDQQHINAFAKWRNVFAAWLLGSDRKYAARDLYEKVLLLRAEVNALTKVLSDAGHLDLMKFSAQIAQEMTWLDAQYRDKFPGIGTSAGSVDLKLPEALETATRHGFEIADVMWEPHASGSGPWNAGATR